MVQRNSRRRLTKTNLLARSSKRKVGCPEQNADQFPIQTVHELLTPTLNLSLRLVEPPPPMNDAEVP